VQTQPAGRHAATRPVAANKKPAKLSPFSAQLVAAMNAARKAHGLRPLAAVESIGKIASGWSGQLANADQLSHNPRLASQVQRIFPNWRRIEENVGVMGAGAASSASDGQQLAEAYLASPVHRANILDPTVHWIGVANAMGGGAIWNTVDFVG
jgi:uncharacterized protein YkwD